MSLLILNPSLNLEHKYSSELANSRTNSANFFNSDSYSITVLLNYLNRKTLASSDLCEIECRIVH